MSPFLIIENNTVVGKKLHALCNCLAAHLQKQSSRIYFYRAYCPAQSAQTALEWHLQIFCGGRIKAVRNLFRGAVLLQKFTFFTAESAFYASLRLYL